VVLFHHSFGYVFLQYVTYPSIFFALPSTDTGIEPLIGCNMRKSHNSAETRQHLILEDWEVVEKRNPQEQTQGRGDCCHLSMMYFGISLLSRGPTLTFQPLAFSISPLIRETRSGRSLSIEPRFFVRKFISLINYII
jgi:hypothetical protein